MNNNYNVRNRFGGKAAVPESKHPRSRVRPLSLLRLLFKDPWSGWSRKLVHEWVSLDHSKFHRTVQSSTTNRGAWLVRRFSISGQAEPLLSRSIGQAGISLYWWWLEAVSCWIDLASIKKLSISIRSFSYTNRSALWFRLWWNCWLYHPASS